MNNSTLNQLEQDLKQGRLSRRDFIKAAALFGLSASVPGLLSGQNAYAATPQAGGHFKLGIGTGATTDSLDPALVATQFTQITLKSIHNYLTEVKADGSLGPELAVSWDASPDAKTWTFELRKDVEFHNGKKLTASDVIASLNYHGGPDSKSPVRFMIDEISTMKADSEHTLVVELVAGNADFAQQMSDYHLVILPADQNGKIDAESNIGCGSYVLESFEPGTNAHLSKFDNHWNDQEGHFDSAEIIVINDIAARLNSLRTGVVDAIDRLDIKTLDRLEREQNVRILETSGNSHYTMPMRCDLSPFKDNNIRMALKHCIDREAMLETLLRGHGYLGNDHPIGRANRYLAKDLEQRSYDPDQAKHYLKKAGIDQLKIQLSTSDAAFPEAIDAATLYREHAAKAGIDVEIVREPADGYFSDVWKKKPFIMNSWYGRPTEHWMLSTVYTSDAKWNGTFWNNERFDKLIKEGRSELDDSKRADIYAEAQRIVRDEGGTGIPLFNNYLFASHKTIVQPEQLGNDLDLDGLRAIVRWWRTG